MDPPRDRCRYLGTQKDLGLWEEHTELGCKEGTGAGWEGGAVQVRGTSGAPRSAGARAEQAAVPHCPLVSLAPAGAPPTVPQGPTRQQPQSPAPTTPHRAALLSSHPHLGSREATWGIRDRVSAWGFPLLHERVQPEIPGWEHGRGGRGL